MKLGSVEEEDDKEVVLGTPSDFHGRGDSRILDVALYVYTMLWLGHGFFWTAWSGLHWPAALLGS